MFRATCDQLCRKLYACGLMLLLMHSAGATADPIIRPVKRLASSGDIVGQLVFCESSNDAAQIATLFISGQPFVTQVLSSTPSFRFLNVPAGTYSIVIERTAWNTAPIVLDAVTVSKRRVTDLGLIEICADACSAPNSCADNEFCYAPTGTCGHLGYCQTLPDACPEVYSPVCGCDGQTYSNLCAAAMAGVNVAHSGECTPKPQRCGGLAGIACPQEQICIDDPSDECDPKQGGADCGGICVDR